MPKITVAGGPSHADADAEEAAAAERAAEARAVETRTDYSALSFKELRDAARERGLPTGGTADELRARLEDADEDDATADGENKTHDQDELKQRLDEQP